MCLTTKNPLEKPIKEMIGYKLLQGYPGIYLTPHQDITIKKNQKYLKAQGPQDVRRYNNTLEYHGGFIHCYKTRQAARDNVLCGRKIIKVKCYNVRAFGLYGDLVCDKIEFLWDHKV